MPNYNWTRTKPKPSERIWKIVGFAGTVAEAAADSEAYRGVIAEAEDLREDIVTPSFPQELILSNVGGGENGYFPVKKRRHDAK